MSDATAAELGIGHYLKTIQEKSAEAYDWRSKAGERKRQLAAREAELADLRKQVEALTAERDDYKGRLTAQPNELRAQLDQAVGKLREIAHKGAFAAVAKSKGIDADRVDALYQLSGYQPEGDDPDEATIGERIEATVAKHASLFQPPAAAGNEPPPAPRKGPGTERGGPAKSSDGVFTVRTSDAHDAGWMHDNAARIAEAYKAGTLRFVDDAPAPPTR